MDIRPRRSVLYMPGSNARAIAKARSLAADAIVLDLEDAVAPDQKAVARDQVVEALRAGGFGGREVVVRINALASPWGAEDVAALAAAAPDALLIPKVCRPEDVLAVGERLAEVGAGASIGLWAMMETPQAILAAPDIAQTARGPGARLHVLVMGTNDLMKETGVRATKSRGALLPWLMTCVAAARSFGLDVIDGVFGDMGDAEGFRAECEQGRDFGMDGKSLIHPNQIEACNAIFAPDPDEIAWANRLIAAFEAPENATKGAIALDGKMVERLHADMGRRTLAMAQAIALRS